MVRRATLRRRRSLQRKLNDTEVDLRRLQWVPVGANPTRVRLVTTGGYFANEYPLIPVHVLEPKCLSVD